MREKIPSILKKIARKIKKMVFGPTAPEAPPTPQSAPQSSEPPAAKKEPEAPKVQEPKVEKETPPQTPEANLPVQSDLEVEAIETPNPNAYKFKVNTKVAPVSFSVASLEEAKENLLAKALIQLEGVSSIFGVHDFVTVTKKSAVDWEELNPKIIATLQEFLKK